MKPSLGRIVLVDQAGLIEPAIITKVHSDSLVNVRVLSDGPDRPPWLTSVRLFPDEATWMDHRDNPEPVARYTLGAYWPPRV